MNEINAPVNLRQALIGLKSAMSLAAAANLRARPQTPRFHFPRLSSAEHSGDAEGFAESRHSAVYDSIIFVVLYMHELVYLSCSFGMCPDDGAAAVQTARTGPDTYSGHDSDSRKALQLLHGVYNIHCTGDPQERPLPLELAVNAATVPQEAIAVPRRVSLGHVTPQNSRLGPKQKMEHDV